MIELGDNDAAILQPELLFLWYFITTLTMNWNAPTSNFVTKWYPFNVFF